jgi:hypothetical protein
MLVEIHTKGATSLTDPFKNRLSEQCARIGLALSFDPGASAGTGSDRGIAVVFAEKGSAWAVKDDPTFMKLLAAGVSVLPVIPDAPSAKYLPSALSHVNAFVKRAYGKAWAECLADEVLSLAWLRRRTPKVFISYKRLDSGRIASQLFDRLNHLGYETFLDEASVRRGADFQRELKWWLNDVDLLVVLASPRFPSSKWCMEEISFCQQRFIGVAAIQWPDEIYDSGSRLRFPKVNAKSTKPVIVSAAMSDQVLTLKPSDFLGVPRRGDPNLPARELTRGALDRVVAMCARQRTIAIRQRLEELIPLAQRVLPSAAPVAHCLGDLTFHDLQGGTSFVRVLPFRPKAENIYQACIEGAGYGVAGCFYAENDPRDPRAEALRWLANGKRASSATLSEGRVWACCGGVLL